MENALFVCFVVFIVETNFNENFKCLLYFWHLNCDKAQAKILIFNNITKEF